MADTKVARLTIGGRVCVTGDYGAKTWTQSLGVEAPSITWDFSVADAAAILAGPREVTIEMQNAAGVKKTIKRVYVVREADSPDDLVRRITFSDVRYYLPFAWVRASYNVRAQSGTFRQVLPDSQPGAAPPPVIPNWTLAPYSLKNEATTYSAFEIALNVVELATKGHDFKDIVVKNLARPRTSFKPNDIYVDAQGQVAIGQTLGALGGLDIRVNDDGEIEIVNAYLGAEKSTIDPILKAYSLEWKGRMRWIDMGNVAPQGGISLYTRRCEIRADSWEGAPSASGNASTVGDDVTWGRDNTPTMINVIPVTDQSLPYPSAADPTTQGNYLPLSQYCQGVGAKADTTTGTPAAFIPLTRSKILAGAGGAKSASPLQSERLEGIYASDHGTGIGANVVWSARCAAIKNFTRTLYKLNPVFARQCLPGSIKAERVGLLDASTGTRQPATVYMDYVQRPVGPGFATDDKFGWIVNSIPPNTPNTQQYPSGSKSYSDPGPYNVNPFRLDQATSAPFQTQCYDPTTGVFFFSGMAQDMTKIKHAANVMPGLVWTLPSGKGGNLFRGLAFSTWINTQKLLTHRVALVFSAIPGGPNGPNGLHRYDSTVARALALLGAPGDSVTPRAPKREFRVREGTALARIPWDDDKRQEILGCFSSQGTQSPEKLIPVNSPELQDFSDAVFANFLAAVLNHYEGTMTVGFMPTVMPVGSLTQVQHTFEPGGGVYTTLRATGVTPSTRPEDLISQSSRNVLFRGIT